MITLLIILGTLLMIALFIYYIFLIAIELDFYEDGKDEFYKDLKYPFRFWIREIKRKIDKLN